MAHETFWVGIDRSWRVRAAKDEVGPSVGRWCWMLRRGEARRRGRNVEVEVGAEEGGEAQGKARQGRKEGRGGGKTRRDERTRQRKARQGESSRG